MKPYTHLFACSLMLFCQHLLAEPAKQWHTYTMNFQGPETSEAATPNPFLDYRLNVTFKQDDKVFLVPGYYAADGNAANTSADSGNVWQVKFAPPTTGQWTWSASFRKGEAVAVDKYAQSGESAGFFDGKTGSFTVVPSDKEYPDIRARGTLQYDGTRYPKTIGDGKIFFKAGVDAPENLLAYADFDGDFKTDNKKDHFIKTWEAHVQDWNEGDPSWGDGKGKGLIGAVNYLSSKGMNSISFLTMNINGDDANVFPYTNYEERERMDVSRLAQWEIFFEHAASKGMFLHFKTQETENETLLDKGDVGKLRTLYYRELIARFSHHGALNWNTGEENGKWSHHGYDKVNLQSKEQRLEMARYFHENDPYKHPIVIHNGQWFNDLYGPDSLYTGASIQTNKPDFSNVHGAVLRVLEESKKAGKVWMAACDEPGDASKSLLPDVDDPGREHARQNALWGVFLAGGWGIEWYFGYKFPHSDLTCQDFRVREKMWKQCRHALEFFRKVDLPLEEMTNQNNLLIDAQGFCLAQVGEVYLTLLKTGSEFGKLKLEAGEYELDWYDPRNGGALRKGSLSSIKGGEVVSLGAPPAEADKDWIVLVRKKS